MWISLGLQAFERAGLISCSGAITDFLEITHLQIPSQL